MDQGEVQIVDQIAVTVLVQGWQCHLQEEDDQDADYQCVIVIGRGNETRAIH